MDLYIYNENLELTGICDTFISLIWVQRYNSAGSFELYCPAIERNIELLKAQTFVHRKECNETMYISTIEEIEDADNGKCIRVSGYGVEGIFRKRVIDKSILPAKLLPTIEHYLNSNPIVSIDFSDETLDNSPVKTSSFIGENLETFIHSTLISKDFAYKLLLDHNSSLFRMKFYEGVDVSTEIVFSDEFGNVDEMVYSYSEKGCYNVIICKCNVPESGVEYSYLPTITLGEKAGLSRNEKMIYVDPVISTGYRYVDDNYVSYKYLDVELTKAEMQSTAKAELQEYTENLSADVIANGYRTKWNVGDAVTVRNEGRKTSFIKRIEEVKECFSNAGVKISHTFGKPLKTIYDLIGG